MNDILVMGYREIVSKKNNEKYVELHLMCEDKDVTGNAVFTVFANVNDVSNYDILDVGCKALVYYNRFGRVQSVALSI